MTINKRKESNMKFIHMSDLHLGKRLLERSFIDDQKYILEKIFIEIKKEKPDGVIIAGDIYDKSVPSAEAVELFDDFLGKLALLNTEVFIISGNHDSAERIAFGSSIFSKQHIHISPVFHGDIKPISFDDTDIWLLPFIKPIHVKSIYKEEEINSYNDALQCVISHMDIDSKKVNILVAHQFVTGASYGGSEESLSVGGLDNINADVFDAFDYVALGHIHKTQTIHKKIRYSGTPLKYSFDESSNKNSLTLLDIEKGKLDIQEIPLEPKRDLVAIKGKYKDVMSKEYIATLNLENYYQITLTDEEDIPDGANKLRAVYPNLLKLVYDNKRTRSLYSSTTLSSVGTKTTIELFDEFYTRMNGKELSEKQTKIMNEVIEEAGGNQ